MRIRRNLNNSKVSDSRISARDILIPVFSAVFALFLNQLFFESNKKIESKIEFEKENFKNQMPVLNRILAFTYKYETTTLVYVTFPVQEFVYKNAKTGQIIKREKKRLEDKADTSRVTFPTFIVNGKSRNKFLDDIETLRKQRDLLDHEIYIAFDKIIDFIDEHELPDRKVEKELLNSKWKDKTVQNSWNEIVYNLREICIKKIDEFNNSSR